MTMGGILMGEHLSSVSVKTNWKRRAHDRDSVNKKLLQAGEMAQGVQ